MVNYLRLKVGEMSYAKDAAGGSRTDSALCTLGFVFIAHTHREREDCQIGHLKLSQRQQEWYNSYLLNGVSFSFVVI